MEPQIIEVSASFYNGEDDEYLTFRKTVEDVRNHPLDDNDALHKIIQNFEKENDVCIDSGGDGDNEHSFDFADHDFSSREELEECMKNVLNKICQRVRNEE